MEKLEKVIAGLEYCGTDAYPEACHVCPYTPTVGLTCAGDLMADTLEVIVDLQEKLKTAKDGRLELARRCRELEAERDAAREKLCWLEEILPTPPNDWGEYPPEFPREGM